MHKYNHPRPSVAVDLVLFGIREEKLVVLLGRRVVAPHRGRACLPGTYIHEDESAADACDRKIKAIGLQHSYLEQLFTFTAPGRDPRERVMTIAHFGLVTVPAEVPSGDDKISHLVWEDVVTAAGRTWAFDHASILETAVDRLRAKIQYAPVSPHFLDQDFTLTELSLVYGAILGRKIDLSNFRRDLLRQDLVVAVGTRKVRGPLATTYRWNWENKTAFFLSLG